MTVCSSSFPPAMPSASLPSPTRRQNTTSLVILTISAVPWCSHVIQWNSEIPHIQLPSISLMDEVLRKDTMEVSRSQNSSIIHKYNDLTLQVTRSSAGAETVRVTIRTVIAVDQLTITATSIWAMYIYRLNFISLIDLSTAWSAKKKFASYGFRAEIQGTGNRSAVTIKNC